MKFLSWISYALFAAATVTAYDAPTKLEIDSTYTPTNCSKKAAKGDYIHVHYTGTLHKTGSKFDSSLDRGQPLPLTLGVGQVIQGWDQGLQGMCVNEKRKLTISSHLAYGTRGIGDIIPTNSALVFDVELISIQSRDEL